MKWNKVGNTWSTSSGPYMITVAPKADGRWNWTIISSGKPNPEATGIRASLGAAKTACEQFVARSGLV